MGEYNPHRPSVLGQEWAPVHPENVRLDYDTEVGNTFILDTSSTVVSGSFFVSDLPPSYNGKIATLAVYRRGEEALGGPVKRTVIPVSVVATNIPDPLEGVVNIVGASTGAQAVANPADGSYIIIQGIFDITFNFSANSFSGTLSGKRILDANILIGLAGTAAQENVSDNTPALVGGSEEYFYDQFRPAVRLPTEIQELTEVGLGNTFLWLAAAPGGTSHRYPLRYPDLQRFESGASVPLVFRVFGSSTDAIPINVNVLYFTYVALEVIYCEETRLLYGGRGGPMNSGLTFMGGVGADQNVVYLRPSDTFAVTGKVLQPGEYSVTATMGNYGDNLAGTNFEVYALRQKYEIPTHSGVQLNLTKQVDAVAERETVDVLPRILLHTASATITGVHAYDQQVIGNVYNNADVVPDVVQRSGGAAVPYPQVRFYARRFGDTSVPLVLRRFTAPATRVEISVADFDTLPEIVDGWRAVTLRFADALIPTYSDAGTTITWEWVADGLDAGSQWQVLTPYGPSIATTAYDGDRATYGGATAFTTATGQPALNDADATLLFSQDPPAVTGLAVEVAEQSLTPIGDECDVDPKCVPTGLTYHHVTWNARDVEDTFDNRTTAQDWEDAESGQTWQHVNGSADDYYVSGGAGVMRIDTTNTLYTSLVEALAFNVEVRGRFLLPVAPTNAAVSVHVLGRLEDSSNYYEAQLVFGTTGPVTLSLSRCLGGTTTAISTTVTLDGPHVAGDVWNVALRAQASQVLARAWRDEAVDPGVWQVVSPLPPGDLVTGTGAGVIGRALTGNTNVPFELQWLNFSATSLDVTAFELQRLDTVDEEWQTIMRSSGTATREFSDYEARIGYESFYRARTINALEFYGAWTASGTAGTTSTLPAPGVTGIGAEGNSVLIFTTNERPDGSGNLAYVMTWEGDVTEDFAFPEAGTVQLRDLYRRDFPLAFRPLERGGERFTRDLLVHNAAVPSGRVRDGFRSLRDMAWEDVSYVCVRNELGDRWFATVLVPTGRVRRNRRLYVARVEIVEVSDAPSVVDPTEEV